MYYRTVRGTTVLNIGRTTVGQLYDSGKTTVSQRERRYYIGIVTEIVLAGARPIFSPVLIFFSGLVPAGYIGSV
jgi:hypothetical protein